MKVLVFDMFSKVFFFVILEDKQVFVEMMINIKKNYSIIFMLVIDFLMVSLDWMFKDLD